MSTGMYCTGASFIQVMTRQERFGASSRSPWMVEGLDWILELAMPFASTPASSPRFWLKWWVVAPSKARLSKRHGFSVPLSRTSAPSGSSLALELSAMAPLPFSEELVGELSGICAIY